jgi:DNA invertase Pin-like site-specific DNA recombinase
MYGYMRAPDDMPDDELDHAVHEMQRFAETEGFCYATTFFEYQPGSHLAFAELIQELKRAEARHVVVPSLAHLSSHRILLCSMVERLELDASAHVLTPDGS